MNTQSEQCILVLDADFRYLDALKKDPKTHGHPLLAVNEGRIAQTELMNPQKDIAGIFVNPNARFQPDWLSVIRCCYQNRPATPIYIILDKDKNLELGQVDVRRLGVKDSIKKPFSYSQMISLVAPLTLSFDARIALEKSKKLQADNPEDLTSDGQFVAIKAEDFLSGTKSLFDVFVKIGGAKFIKLLTAGDAFTVDRIETYINKGLTHFYIRKEVQEVYLSYCDHLAKALLSSDAAPQEFKLSQVLNQGDEVMNHMKVQGVSEKALKYAQNFVANVREMSRQIVETESGFLKGFMQNTVAYEHGVATAMVAGILANAMDLSSEKPVEVVGMAALFHDSALSEMPEKLWEENEAEMTAEEIKLYRSHPELAANNLKKIPKFDSTAALAISQHHMRLGSRGFPERTGTTLMSRIAEIVGISDEAVKLMLRFERNPKFNIFHELETQVFPSFSRPVIDAFKTAFYSKQYNMALKMVKKG